MVSPSFIAVGAKKYHEFHYHEAPVQTTLQVPNESFEIPPQVSATVSAEIISKLKRNVFHNWVDPVDWTERDLARMTPEAREVYERFMLSDRPKYIPMKPEKLAKLSPEDRQEYEREL